MSKASFNSYVSASSVRRIHSNATINAFYDCYWRKIKELTKEKGSLTIRGFGKFYIKPVGKNGKHKLAFKASGSFFKHRFYINRELQQAIFEAMHIGGAEIERLMNLMCNFIHVSVEPMTGPLKIPGFGKFVYTKIPSRTGKAFGKEYTSLAHWDVKYYPFTGARWRA